MGTTYKELFQLYDLIQSGDVSSVESFLSNKDINLNEILPWKGIGILHLAVGIEPLEKSTKCTEIILRHGGDPNLCNDDGVTPVHIAAIWGRVDNLKLLIGFGGDPMKWDLDGLSAFDYAAREEQWDVYDYLHHVEDQFDDSFESPCAYSLDLEKVLLTTDQMVAEYEPVPEPIQSQSICRKSDMVRDWCDKTSLAVNKLYPTILCDTFTIDSDPTWRSINLTKNMTLDLTSDRSISNLNDTNLSFKTCRSKSNDVDISGIERLEITDCKSKSLDSKKRESVYENFSLPGSPNSIIHRNYNSKTSLKRNKVTEVSDRSHKSDSLLNDGTNCTSYMDRAMAVAQNRTNEWLSSSGSRHDTDVYNTRRSSASSGVSSNFSGGSIALAHIEEEYKYEDKEEDVVLLEKRLLVSSIVLPVEESDNSPDQTIVSVASSLPPTMDYSSETLRKELQALGFNPGPILASNKTLYLKKLQTLKKNPVVVVKEGKTYSIELEKSLRSDNWMRDLSGHIDLENKARADFSDPNKKWREGTAKTSFTYLLLDPRLTANLPSRAPQQSQHATWTTFVNSIFYVGKGKRSRPYSHLYQALTLWKRNFTSSQDKKVQNILDIWSDNVGVVCLHIFQNVIPAEAYTYEAAMIDVLGLQNLKNLKSGNYYGAVLSWPMKDRRMLGLYLLYKAMLIFLSEGERQLRPDDID